MSDYPFCKTVKIHQRFEKPIYIELIQWLRDQNWRHDFDYSVEAFYGGPNGYAVAWNFVFDDARKAVAFKLVWG